MRVVVLVVLSLVISLAALVLAARPWLAQRRARGDDASVLPGDVLGLRQEVAALRGETRGALRHLAIVRYDAFGDVGGNLSWSLALADETGGGVVLTSISGRSEVRSYAKSIVDWSCEQPLSPEEGDALEAARPAH